MIEPFSNSHAGAQYATSYFNGPIIFGRSVPRRGRAPGWSCPVATPLAAHLIEISAAVDPGAHAVLIVDQAGWHLTPKLAIPDRPGAAATIARVEPGGECLAIHARQLVVECAGSSNPTTCAALCCQRNNLIASRCANRSETALAVASMRLLTLSKHRSVSR